MDKAKDKEKHAAKHYHDQHHASVVSLSVPSFSSIPRRSSFASRKSDASSSQNPKKSVTIQSQMTVLYVHDEGSVMVTRDSPYYKKGCRGNIRMVATMDLIISAIGVILCIAAIALTFVVLEEARDKEWKSFVGEFEIRELLHTIIVFGGLLIFVYCFEITLGRKLYFVTTDPDMTRREATARSKNWQCGNLVLITVEVLFWITTLLDWRTLVSGSLVLLGSILRILGIVIAYQFIRDIDSMTVTPVVHGPHDPHAHHHHHHGSGPDIHEPGSDHDHLHVDHVSPDGSRTGSLTSDGKRRKSSVVALSNLMTPHHSTLPAHLVHVHRRSAV